MLEADVKANVLSVVKAYRNATGESLSEVSRKFYGKGNFLSEFIKGKHSISLGKLDEMLSHIFKKWPEKADLPELPPIFMSRYARNAREAAVAAAKAAAERKQNA
jgi:hypothetical protein